MCRSGTRTRTAFHQQRKLQPQGYGISGSVYRIYDLQEVWRRYTEFAINRIPEGLASKEPKEIRAELSKTRNAMAEIHNHISDEMFRKKQERSKDYER